MIWLTFGMNPLKTKYFNLIWYIFFYFRPNFFDEKKYTIPNFIFISFSDDPICTKKSVNQEIEKTVA